jgi:hypothetical protein
MLIPLYPTWTTGLRSTMFPCSVSKADTFPHTGDEGNEHNSISLSDSRPSVLSSRREAKTGCNKHDHMMYLPGHSASPRSWHSAKGPSALGAQHDRFVQSVFMFAPHQHLTFAGPDSTGRLYLTRRFAEPCRSPVRRRARRP